MAVDQPKKRVIWAELFFDLVYVFAVTQVSTLLDEQPGWLGVAEALIILSIIYWGWVSIVVYTNQRDVNNPVDIVCIFLLGLSSLYIALAVPGADNGRALLFGGSYLFLRIFIYLLALKNLHEWRKIQLATFNVGVLVTGPLLLIGGLTGKATRLILWSLAALADTVAPWALRRSLARMEMEPQHYPHRFGLLLIIALGESLVRMSRIASAHPLTPQRLATVGAAYTLSCSLWWIYFRYAVRAYRRAIEANTPLQADIRRSVLLYAHLLFLSGAVAVSAGLADAVTRPNQPLPHYSANLLFGGCALYLAGFEYTRWRLLRSVSWQHIALIIVCLVILPLTTALPALPAVLVLAAVVIMANLAQHRRARLGRLWEVDTARQSKIAPRPHDGDEAGQTDTGPGVGD